MRALFALTQGPTPVFNTSELATCFGGENGDTLPLDDQNLMRTVETVLFPNTLINLLEQIPHSTIWKIATDEYPYPGDLYIDNRFIHIVNSRPAARKIDPPSISAIQQRMNHLEHTRYIWGGNWPEGINALPKLYPSQTNFHKLKPHIQDTWRLKGVDCSGLLHYATNGFTPRNTSSLVHFGTPVDIEGKNTKEILQEVRELDMIVWTGHVVCVLDHKTTIESRAPVGVVKTDAYERLSEIMAERKPVNKWGSTHLPHFVIRRWSYLCA
jgi:hypothetical protein